MKPNPQPGDTNSTDRSSDLPTGSARWLILIPTEFERRLVQHHFDSEPDFSSAIVETCGFGPIIPAARTVQLIQQHRPSNILLMGIAGAFESNTIVGDAFMFDSVACYGVGVGQGRSFQSAAEMGWKHWPGNQKSDSKLKNELEIGDRIDLQNSIGDQRLLLTVTSASGNETDVADRLKVFPRAFAEDMEGFAVAAACHFSQSPLVIVRGISNRAGDRDKSNWIVKEAMESAVDLGQRLISKKN